MPKNRKKYTERAKEAIIHEAAATAWSKGVPWADALSIAEKAVAKASPHPKRFPRPKAKGRAAKPKPKPKARAS